MSDYSGLTVLIPQDRRPVVYLSLALNHPKTLQEDTMIRKSYPTHGDFQQRTPGPRAYWRFLGPFQTPMIWLRDCRILLERGSLIQRFIPSGRRCDWPMPWKKRRGASEKRLRIHPSSSLRTPLAMSGARRLATVLTQWVQVVNSSAGAARCIHYAQRAASARSLITLPGRYSFAQHCSSAMVQAF
jgi:hypothetical protein